MAKSSICGSSQKFIKDCIYGHISVPNLCVKFMDVPEFQRLRRIHQLGMVHYSYPSASHTRFEHSLGVMHLAGCMVDHLRTHVNIPDRIKELIQLAGMYHDIGHFAYSHLFDHFLSQVEDNNDIPVIFKIKHHEDRSLHFLRKVNDRLNLLDKEEENFVCDVIIGHIPPNSLSYLYEIINNKDCGIDVDKMDYLERDSQHTGFPGFQSGFIILNTMVEPRGHIAFKHKLRNDISDLFLTRQRMFENVYYHHTSKKLDKIYFCLMKSLGHKLFTYGENTDDYNIETLIRNDNSTSELIQCVDRRELTHECDQCKEYGSSHIIKQSGSIDRVRFM